MRVWYIESKNLRSLIGKSPSTLRRWEKEGKIKPRRSKGNQRYYTDKDLQIALNIERGGCSWRRSISNHVVESKTDCGKIIVYCRVSSRGQNPELQHQIVAMEEFCRGQGLAVDEWVSEIGGGLYFKRKKFLKLMRQIRLGEVETVVLAHKDRLARFAYDFIEEFASWYGCKIVIANQESLSPQREMVEDLMAIIHTFSCRLYGLRSYKKQIKKIAEISIDSTDFTK